MANKPKFDAAEFVAMHKKATQLDPLYTFISYKHHNDKTWKSEK